jgi:major membrane immunogen (membrane-anchored lipoprotein)
MANDINSGATLEKPKKFGQKQSKDSDKWTFGRSVLFLLITFDLIAVLAWLIYYHSLYEDISKIVGGVWAAVLTFLSYMKIKRGRRMSLVEFTQILPVKMVIITYTVIIFLLVVIFVFDKVPVHTVQITAYLNDNPQSGVLIFWDDKTYKTEEDGTYEIHSVEAGDHTLSGNWKGNISDTITVTVLWWPLKHHEIIIIPCTKGNIRISSSYKGKTKNGAEIYIDGKKQDKQTPITLRNLLPGEYSIKLIKTDEDYCYEAVKEITVKAGKTLEAEMKLKPVTGNIHIISYFNGEALNRAEIYIDGKEQNKQTPATLKNLSAGEYSIKLVKIIDDYCYEEEKEITVEAGKTTVAEMGLKLVGQLCKLEIRSNPTGASIYVNEKSHGTTDTTVKLCPGTYKIRLEKSGYKTTYKEVIIKEPINSITIPLSIE